VPVGTPKVESAIESLRVLTRSFSGVREKGVMSVTGAWDEGAAKGSPAFGQATTMGVNA
jgi:hypothetical protein